MVNITKETYENNEIEVITDEFGKLWLNERHVQEQLGHKNLPALTNKYDEKYKKCRYELNESTKQPHRRFIHNDLALKIIMDCRTDESCNLKRNLGFTLHDVINTKEQTIINTIRDAFDRENMQTQYTVLGNRIDLYFHKYKLAIEVDELGHNDIDYEIQRQQALERKLDCALIRIDPDTPDFNIFREINKMHRHIKRSSKKYLIDKISKRILELEFVDDHLSRCLKQIVRKTLPKM